MGAKSSALGFSLPTDNFRGEGADKWFISDFRSAQLGAAQFAAAPVHGRLRLACLRRARTILRQNCADKLIIITDN